MTLNMNLTAHLQHSLGIPDYCLLFFEALSNLLFISSFLYLLYVIGQNILTNKSKSFSLVENCQENQEKTSSEVRTNQSQQSDNEIEETIHSVDNKHENDNSNLSQPKNSEQIQQGRNEITSESPCVKDLIKPVELTVLKSRKAITNSQIESQFNESEIEFNECDENFEIQNEREIDQNSNIPNDIEEVVPVVVKEATSSVILQYEPTEAEAKLIASSSYASYLNKSIQRIENILISGFTGNNQQEDLLEFRTRIEICNSWKFNFSNDEMPVYEQMLLKLDRLYEQWTKLIGD